MPRITIDPVSRIEGHLRITAIVEGGRVTDAWNSATQFRGFEIFMRGRDPRDAWHYGQRICGVCPTPHALAAVQASERAMGIDKIPDAARLVRNMMEASHVGYDHILWFYILNAFDYVNVPDALNARPTLPSLKRVQEQVKAVVDSGQLGPFANGFWDHPGYRLDPDENLELTAHYLQSIEVQQKANDAAARLGGKFPMIMNLTPGGVTQLPTEEEILFYRDRMQEVQEFVNNVMVQDLLMVAPAYLDHARFGKGVGNYLTWGLFEAESQEMKDRFFPPGAIFESDLTNVEDVNPNNVKFYTRHSWYDDDMGGGKGPFDAAQDINKINYTELEPIDKADGPVEGKYDWTKAVRYGDRSAPMEVGPLADMLVAYVRGHEDVRAAVDTVLEAIGQAGRPQVLMSALGRIAARVVRAKVNADNALRWSDELLGAIRGRNIEVAIDRAVPDSGEGVGTIAAPRGALSHYMRIEGGRIGKYAAIPASNWNLSPRDDDNRRGPVEAALIGTPVADPERPLEILRVVHTFDP